MKADASYSEYLRGEDSEEELPIECGE
jgi:hypothetical protein